MHGVLKPSIRDQASGTGHQAPGKAKTENPRGTLRERLRSYLHRPINLGLDVGFGFDSFPRIHPSDEDYCRDDQSACAKSESVLNQFIAELRKVESGAGLDQGRPNHIRADWGSDLYPNITSHTVLFQHGRRSLAINHVGNKHAFNQLSGFILKFGGT